MFEALSEIHVQAQRCRKCQKPRPVCERLAYGRLCEDCWAVWQHHIHGYSSPLRIKALAVGAKISPR